MSASDQEKFDSFIQHPAVAAYVGNNFDYYRDVWSRQFAKKKTIAAMRGDILKGAFASFNLPALLLLVPWSFYRKNVKPAALVGLVLFAVFSMQIITGMHPPGLFYLVLIIGVGSMANAYYFDQVWEFVETNGKLGPEELKQLALAKGGTSVGFMLGGVIAYALVLGLAIGVIKMIMGG